MTTKIFPSEVNESLIGVNVQVTSDERDNPITVIEKGNAESTRLMVEFGENGKRFCRVISDRITVSSCDAIVKNGSDSVVTIAQGVPSEGTLELHSTSVKPIKSMLVKREGVDDNYTDLLNIVETKKEIYDALKEIGIIMSRTEEGVLSGTADYNFLVASPDSEIFVNIGNRKYIKSEGFTSLMVSEGTVYLKTSTGGSTAEVVVNIA